MHPIFSSDFWWFRSACTSIAVCPACCAGRGMPGTGILTYAYHIWWRCRDCRRLWAVEP